MWQWLSDSREMLPRLGLGLCAVLLLVCVALAGCQFLDLPQATPTVELPAPSPSPGGDEQGGTPQTPAPGETDIATPSAPSVVTLTLWTTEAYSPTRVLTTGQVLGSQLDAFFDEEPELGLEIVLKKPYGRGGILDFLLNTSKVVPELLPDLVVMDTFEVGSAVNAGLLQPLDDILPGELVGDLFPFAQQACSVDGKLYCIQLYADFEHLVYNTALVLVPPRSWVTTLNGPGPYCFPAGGSGGLVNDAFWIQYLALPPPEPQDGVVPLLDAERLTRVFQFYVDGLERDIILADVAEYDTSDACWPVYLNGQAAMTHATVRRYLTDRGLLRNSDVSSIPTGTGRAMTISRGWGIALVARQASRQQAAAALIDWLASPANSARWTYAAKYSPTRRAALPLWGDDTAYRSFVEQQLEAARPRPSIPDYTRVATVLQQGVQKVVQGLSSPEAAANEVLRSLQGR
jgi:ABC-type glycerol-3-phosphate transport system substrate-binding protein